MSTTSNKQDIASEGQALADLLKIHEPNDSLEALFTPLQANDPVEQLVRRT